jgi:hypothetical protein
LAALISAVGSVIRLANSTVSCIRRSSWRSALSANVKANDEGRYQKIIERLGIRR